MTYTFMQSIYLGTDTDGNVQCNVVTQLLTKCISCLATTLEMVSVSSQPIKYSVRNNKQTNYDKYSTCLHRICIFLNIFRSILLITALKQIQLLHDNFISEKCPQQ